MKKFITLLAWFGVILFCVFILYGLFLLIKYDPELLLWVFLVGFITWSMAYLITKDFFNSKGL